MLYNIKLQKNNIYLKIMATPWLLSTKKKKSLFTLQRTRAVSGITRPSDLLTND
jgi:hypothetical protein